MTGSAGQPGTPVQYRGGWEGQLGKRVFYRGQPACIVHADLFRLVLRTDGTAPQRVVVDESDWAAVILIDSECGTSTESEVA